MNRPFFTVKESFGNNTQTTKIHIAAKKGAILHESNSNYERILEKKRLEISHKFLLHSNLSPL